MVALVCLVLQETRAADIGFETGSWPDGLSWNQQPWWRCRVWLEYKAGEAEKFRNRNEEETQDIPPPEWIRVDDVGPTIADMDRRTAEILSED